MCPITPFVSNTFLPRDRFWCDLKKLIYMRVLKSHPSVRSTLRLWRPVFNVYLRILHNNKLLARRVVEIAIAIPPDLILVVRLASRDQRVTMACCRNIPEVNGMHGSDRIGLCETSLVKFVDDWDIRSGTGMRKTHSRRATSASLE